MRRFFPALLTALILGIAGTATAAVLIYDNDFSNAREFGQVERFQGGKACKSARRGERGAVALRVRGGGNCSYRLPVQGDGAQPDQTIQAVMRVLKRTDRRIAPRVYAGVALRANQRTHYELRVFPKGRRWKLVRSGREVAKGRSDAIAALDRKNVLRLGASGRNVQARVNGERLTSFRDEDPEEVTGRHAAIGFGSEAGAKKRVGQGILKRIRVLVPDPTS